MASYILAHDLGTTGNKASLYSSDGCLLASSFQGYSTTYPQVGWAEQNPEDWWSAVVAATRTLLARAKVTARDIACVTFSGQMMGCVPVDRAGGTLRPALIWADQRATAQARRLMESACGQETVYRITGHRPSPAYSAAKIMWLKDNQPEIYGRAYKFLHAKDFVVMRLTGEAATDYSDASGMNLFDITTLEWSPVLVDASGIAPEKLPEPHPSTDIVGEVTKAAAEATGLEPGTPVVIGGGDGSCAAAGAGTVREGSAYCYVGSSSWIGLATREPIFDDALRTFNWVHLFPGTYSPTGTMQAAGGSYTWLARNLCPSEERAAADIGVSPYKLMDLEAEGVPPGSLGLVYLPYLMGERSPYWNPAARGAFIGLTQNHTRSHMVRAVLEGVALNLRLILDVFKGRVDIRAVRIIGGGAKSRLWRKIMADVFGRSVLRLESPDEATSLGAAVAGGIGVGLFEGPEVAEELVKIVEETAPTPEGVRTYEELLGPFKESYAALVRVFEKLADVAAS